MERRRPRRSCSDGELRSPLPDSIAAGYGRRLRLLHQRTRSNHIEFLLTMNKRRLPLPSLSLASAAPVYAQTQP